MLLVLGLVPSIVAVPAAAPVFTDDLDLPTPALSALSVPGMAGHAVSPTASIPGAASAVAREGRLAGAHIGYPFAPAGQAAANGHHDAWPREGSLVVYEVQSSGGSPDGAHHLAMEGTVAYTFTAGAWAVRCEGVMVESGYAPDSGNAPVNDTRHAVAAPPAGPSHAKGTILLGVPGCDDAMREYTAMGSERDLGRRLLVGGPVAWQVECGCQTQETRWDARTGLIVDWSFAGRSGGDSGTLVATDHPAFNDPAILG